MRGGARKRAGRKPATEHLKRERITIRLPRWLIEWLKKHTNQGKAIEDALIKQYKIKPFNKSLKGTGKTPAP